jgi:hypothetical protein
VAGKTAGGPGRASDKDPGKVAGKAADPGDKIIPGPSQALRNIYGYGSSSKDDKK